MGEGAQVLDALRTAKSTKIKNLLLGTNHEWWSKDGEWGTNEAASEALAPLLVRQEDLQVLSLFGNKLRGNSPTMILAALRSSQNCLETIKELNLAHSQFNTQKSCEELCLFIAEAANLERCEISGQVKHDNSAGPAAGALDRCVKIEVIQAR